ncbi:Crp/Fnr family transcriptional regulator [Thalassotalea sp. Y01]|uniref:Crp/Fnr family transcriptional regulator n=1 Tax=Thalassotalea sp. Y01 TaxID=2729613 RepID=UPI00145DABE0|nr:Crp/Fnr family transcriptional regulator [Thalassotalea sp. Y01]NMP15479.1 Crp/Fnr family transcriptional regulator [Thalassotalea sp. Y01]
MKQIEQVLKECSWFQGLPDNGLAELTKSARIKHYKDKTYLYRLEDTSNYVYCVLSGFVRVKISSIQGQEFAITEFSTGAWFGEFALTDKPIRMFEAQALEDSQLLEIPKHVVQNLADKHPVIYKNLFLEQTDRTAKMCELLAGMLFYPLSARVAGRLLWFAHHYGQQTEIGVQINKKMSQQEIADLTLGSRQRVNKVIKTLESDGVIAIKGLRYLVKDMAALKEHTRLKND